MSLPAGFVDPYDAPAVAAVVDGVLRTMGPDGLGDLLARMPGCRLEAGVAGRLFRPATPPVAWLGAEHRLELGPHLAYAQVVGGVVLHRTTPTPAEAGPLVARLIGALAREQDAQSEVATVLTAVRGTLDSF